MEHATRSRLKNVFTATSITITINFSLIGTSNFSVFRVLYRLLRSLSELSSDHRLLSLAVQRVAGREDTPASPPFDGDVGDGFDNDNAAAANSAMTAADDPRSSAAVVPKREDSASGEGLGVVREREANGLYLGRGERGGGAGGKAGGGAGSKEMLSSSRPVAPMEEADAAVWGEGRGSGGGLVGSPGERGSGTLIQRSSSKFRFMLGLKKKDQSRYVYVRVLRYVLILGSVKNRHLSLNAGLKKKEQSRCVRVCVCVR